MRIRALAENPDIQGKPLGDDLFGYRSVKVVKARYRILYKTEGDKVVVLVVTIGIRKEGDKKDAYAMAKKLLRLGLLDLVTPLLSSSTSEGNDELDADEKPEIDYEYQYPEPETTEE